MSCRRTSVAALAAALLLLWLGHASPARAEEVIEDAMHNTIGNDWRYMQLIEGFLLGFDLGLLLLDDLPHLLK